MRWNPVRCVLLLLLAACGRGVVDDASTDEMRSGTIDLEIGMAEGGGPAMFGRVTALEMDGDGRILVLDWQANEIRVFGATGDFQFAIGGAGSGPGELQSACCMAFGPDGRLWVRDGGNGRYDVFDVQSGSATHIRSVRMAHGDVNRWAPVTFDSAGFLIDIGFRRDEGSGESRVFRLHLDSAGQAVAQERVHEAPQDSVAIYTVEASRPDGVVRNYMYQPYGPTQLSAYARNGDYAYAISGRYAVAWFGEDGTLLRHLTRTTDPPPAVSASEREESEAAIQATIERIGIARGQVPFAIPSHKPPLRALYFDDLGRLWVGLSVPDGEDRRADVFARDGAYLHTATWPASVDLRQGVIHEDVALGVALDSLDVPRVVRLRFGN